MPAPFSQYLHCQLLQELRGVLTLRCYQPNLRLQLALSFREHTFLSFLAVSVVTVLQLAPPGSLDPRQELFM